MTLKSARSILTLGFLFLLLTGLLPQGNAKALSHPPLQDDLPALDTFISQVQNGQTNELRGVYIPGRIAAPVVQQPVGSNDFVSPRQNILTQFSLASQFGSTGLLAHNDLAGESFSALEKDQTFYLVYGDGSTSAFVVTEILQFQALDPTSITSPFVDLETKSVFSASQVFLKAYRRPGQVVFQTCIARDNDLGWGRLFVIAEPASPQP